MYCKIDEAADMTPNSFSMNTILTSEKQKMNEDHESLKLQHLQLAQEQAATQQTTLMSLQPPPQQHTQHHHHQQQHPQHTQHHHQQQPPQHTQHHKQQMLTTTDLNGNEEIIQQQTQQHQQQQQNKKQKIIDDELPRKEELSSEAKHVHVNLDDSELWKKFKSLTNEMIVTKNGRYGYLLIFFFLNFMMLKNCDFRLFINLDL